MKKNDIENKKFSDRPTIEQIDKELERLEYRKAYGKAMRGTIWVLIVVAALAIIFSTFFFSVLKIQGNSMTPSLNEGEMVVAIKTDDFESGDIIAFYFNNKILLKRAIGSPGEWVDIAEDGTVYIDNEEILEPYVKDKTKGECTTNFPYQVPDNRWFVLGDHRSTSVDSRSDVIGTVSSEQVIGKVVFRIWPFSNFGFVK